MDLWDTSLPSFQSLTFQIKVVISCPNTSSPDLLPCGEQNGLGPERAPERSTSGYQPRGSIRCLLPDLWMPLTSMDGGPTVQEEDLGGGEDGCPVRTTLPRSVRTGNQAGPPSLCWWQCEMRMKWSSSLTQRVPGKSALGFLLWLSRPKWLLNRYVYLPPSAVLNL